MEAKSRNSSNTTGFFKGCNVVDDNILAKYILQIS